MSDEKKTNAEPVQRPTPKLWIVTRANSNRYLGGYEWVRNEPRAAHFISYEVAREAADDAKAAGNHGVTIEEVAPDGTHAPCPETARVDPLDEEDRHG